MLKQGLKWLNRLNNQVQPSLFYSSIFQSTSTLKNSFNCAVKSSFLRHTFILFHVDICMHNYAEICIYKLVKILLRKCSSCLQKLYDLHYILTVNFTSNERPIYTKWLDDKNDVTFPEETMRTKTCSLGKHFTTRRKFHGHAAKMHSSFYKECSL
jgi:hypothetical protein